MARCHFSALLFSLRRLQSVSSHARELSTAREQTYKYSKQLLAHQSHSHTHSHSQPNMAVAHDAHAHEEVDGDARETQHAGSKESLAHAQSRTPSSATPSNSLHLTSLTAPPAVAATPLVFADRTNTVTVSAAAATAVPPPKSSLVDLLQIKPAGAMIGGASKAHATPSLLADLINRAK